MLDVQNNTIGRLPKIKAKMVCVYRELISIKGINRDRLSETGETTYSCPSDILRDLDSSYCKTLRILIEDGYIDKIHQGGIEDGMSIFRKLKEIEDIDIDQETSKLVDALLLKRYEKQAQYFNINGYYFASNSGKVGKRIINGIDFFNEIEQESGELPKQYYRRVFAAIDTVRKFNKGEFFNYKLLCGRDYNSLCNLPREIRSHLKHVTRKVVWVDINACIPRLLGVSVKTYIENNIKKSLVRYESHVEARNLGLYTKQAWKEHLEKKNERYRSTEYNRYYIRDEFDDNLNPELQHVIDDCDKWNQEIVNEDDVYLNIIKAFDLVDISRDAIKRAFLPIIFGNFSGDMLDMDRLAIAGPFRDKFPFLYDFLKKENNRYAMMKKYGKAMSEDSLIYTIFKYEGNIIRRVTGSYGFNRFSLYDAICTLDRHKSTVAQALKKSFQIETGLRYRGKIENELNVDELYNDLIKTKESTKSNMYSIKINKKQHRKLKSTNEKELKEWIKEKYGI